MIYRYYTLSILLILLIFAGCSNNAPKKENFSGFMSDYSNLQPVTLPSGTILLHWRNKILKQGRYKKIILEPMVFYPKPQVNDNISTEVLDTIKSRVDQYMLDLAKKNNVQVTNTPDKDVLRIRSAFTAINITGEEFKAINLLPIMLIVTAAELSVGGRDQDVTMVHEYEVVDSITNESMIRGIRKGKTLQLANKTEKLTMKSVNPLLTKWGMDLTESFNHFAKIFK